MSRWHGPAYKGAMRGHRAAKRREAQTRALMTALAARAAGERLSPVPAGPCPHPWKQQFENRDTARAALARMPGWKKIQGKNEYHCPAGHWHLGRKIRRPYLTWRSAA